MVYRFLLLFYITLFLPLISYSFQEYVVKKGDNLYDLSRKFDVSVDELKDENDLRNNRLNVGDKLLIPNSKNKTTQAKKRNNNVYTVKSGDTLGEIAARHGVSTKDLKNENGLKSTSLQIGQLLGIPPSRESQDSSTHTNEKEQIQNSTANSEKIRPEINGEITVRPKDDPSTEYIVKGGDTLGHIAGRYGITSKSIKEFNSLKSDNLSIGQKLKIPSGYRSGEITESEIISETKPLPATYVVRKGDFPGKIAEGLGVGTKELIELNNLDSKSLQIGQVLKVPGAEAPEQITKETQKNGSLNATPGKKAQKTASTTKNLKQGVYIIKKGDTPGEIAEKLGVSTKDLISMNNLNSQSLRIGQRLKVPGSEIRAKFDAVTKETTAKSSEQSVKTPQAHPEAPQEYIVKKGDSLYVISKRYKISISDIKKKNNLKGNNLSIGQKLSLGSEKTAATAKAGPQNEAKKNDAKTLNKQKRTGKYTVRKGDTVSQIALKFGISQKELKSENVLRSNNLRIGQVLKVPGQSEREEVALAKNTETKNRLVTKKGPEKKQAAYVKKRYVVKAGDTLSGIANHFKVSVQDLKKASALRNDKINKGNVLLIPVPYDYVATPKRAAGAPNYTVVTGDTLGGIASKYGVSVSELKAANGLTNNELWVGMKLKVPGKDGQLKTRTATQATDHLRKDYRVKRGDTLGAIAKRYGVTVKEIKQANKLKSNNIRVGQSLKIPGAAKYMHSYSNGYADNGHSQNGYNPGSDISPKQNIIKVAKKYLGAPYKFGGYSYKTGIDCSGYVKKVFSSFNVELPRTARDIYYRAGYKVPKSQLDTGDLVFFQTYAKFPSHVGIYMGDNQFIHASSARKKVSIDNLNKRYYRNRYIGAKRIQVSGLFNDEYSNR